MRALRGQRRESLGSALVQIAVVAVVLALAVYVVYRRGADRQALGAAVAEARAIALKGNQPDLEAAVAKAREAQQLDDDAPEPVALEAALWTELWLRHHVSGAEQKAREALARAVTLGSQGDDRHGTEAAHLVADGKPAEAEALVEGLRQRGGSGARLFHAQAMALRARGNLPLSRVALNAAADKAWREGNYVCDGSRALLEEGLPGAIDPLLRLRSSHPGLVCVRLYLGLARVLRKDNLEEAERLAADVVKLDEASAPQKALAHAVRAAVRIEQGRLDAATQELASARAADATEPWSLFFEAKLKAARKEPGAAPAYAELTRRFPQIPVFFFDGALDLEAAGKPAEASALLDAYAAFYRDVKNATSEGSVQGYLERDDRYWLARGDLLRASGKAAEALAAYDKAIAVRGSSLARATAAKASLLVDQRDLDKALVVLKDITPSDGTGPVPDAYLTMGEILFTKKEYPAGCESFAFALSRLKQSRAAPERLKGIQEDVSRRLQAAGQTQLARVWADETKALVGP